MQKGTEAKYPEIKILFQGNWTEKDIVIKEVPTTRKTDTKLEERISTDWRDVLEQAAKTKREIWDSALYRLEEVIAVDNSLHFKLSTIVFSARLMMKKYTAEIKRLGFEYSPRGIFNSCLVETTDGYFVFIKKSQKYFSTKEYAWVGGVLSKDEREIKSGQDLFASARREVVEELGVSFLQIDETVLKIGYLTENWNVCLLFSIKLSLSKTEVLEIFRSNSDGEAADLVFLNTDNKSDLLAKFEAQDRTRLALSGII